jgi:hypothetical protein
MQSKQYLLVRGLALGTLAMGLGFLILQIWFFSLSHPHMPIRDTFRFLPLVEQSLDKGISSVPLSEWVAIHAGAHRVLVSRFLMVLDYQFFGGQNHLLQTTSWVSLGILLLLYLRHLKLHLREQPTEFWMIAGICMILLLSPGQFFNLSNPINSSWFVALAASGIVVQCLMTAKRSLGVRQALIALVAGLTAAYSNFSGVFIWILAPVILFLLRSKGAVPCLVVCLVFLGFYLNGVLYNQAIDTNLLDAPTERALGTLQSTLLYLSALVLAPFPVAAKALTLASLVFLLHAWSGASCQLRDSQVKVIPSWYFFLFMATLCLLIAFATAWGRAGFSSETALRYHSVVACYWLSLVCLLNLHPDTRCLGSLLARSILSACLTLFLVFPSFTMPPPKEIVLLQHALRSENRVLSSKDLSRQDYGKILPLKTSDLMKEFTPWLRMRKLSIFRPASISGQLPTSGENLPSCGHRIQLLSDEQSEAGGAILKYSGFVPILSRQFILMAEDNSMYRPSPALLQAPTLKVLMLRPDQHWKDESVIASGKLSYVTILGKVQCAYKFEATTK